MVPSAADLALDRLATSAHRADLELADDPALAFVAWADELGLSWGEGVRRAEVIAVRILRAAHGRVVMPRDAASSTGTGAP